MTKLEYSDFYKFISSLGIVLISMALLLPWLFVRESFDTGISVANLGELTPVAQEIINTRQNALLWFLLNVKWISTFFGFVGLVFLFSGVFFWAKRQQTVDKKEDLELIRLKHEIDGMTPIQIVEKAIRETNRETKVDIKNPALEKTEKLLTKTVSNPVLEYLRIEELLVKKLSACFGNDNVLPNRQIKDSGYDIILLSDKRGLNDVVFEIKTTSRGIGSSQFELTALRLIRSLEGYKSGMNRKVVGVMVLVLLGKDISDKILEQQLRVSSDINKRYGGRIKSIIINEKKVSELNCEDLQDMLFTARTS